MDQKPGERGASEAEDTAGHLRMTDEQLQDGLTPSEAQAARAAVDDDHDDRSPAGDDAR